MSSSAQLHLVRSTSISSWASSTMSGGSATDTSATEASASPCVAETTRAEAAADVAEVRGQGGMPMDLGLSRSCHHGRSPSVIGEPPAMPLVTCSFENEVCQGMNDSRHHGRSPSVIGAPIASPEVVMPCIKVSSRSLACGRSPSATRGSPEGMPAGTADVFAGYYRVARAAADTSTANSEVVMTAAEKIDSAADGDANVAPYNVDPSLGERCSKANKLAKRYLEMDKPITHTMAWEVLAACAVELPAS